MARARFQAADFVRWHGSNPGHGQVWRAKPYPRDLRILRLYLEDRRRPAPPIVVGEDMNPWQDYTGFKRPRVTIKQVKMILADVLKLVNGAAETPAAKALLDQAEQVLAA